MLEYPIARAYADNRVTCIYGGYDRDWRREIVGRSMGLLRRSATTEPVAGG